MHRPILSLAAAACAAAALGCGTPRPAHASHPEASAVMATVHRFVDDFDAGDLAKAAQSCADELSIVDDFPPHEWHGPGALAAWAADYAALEKQEGITDGIVTVGAPRHVDVTGERAYVVAPAEFTCMLNGQRVEQTGCTFTVALKQGPDGWRITGWAWSKR